MRCLLDASASRYRLLTFHNDKKMSIHFLLSIQPTPLMPNQLSNASRKEVKLRLKGVCKESKVDTDYLLLGYEVLDKGGSNRRKYGGSTGWLLSHNKEEDLWSLRHEYYPDLSMTIEEKDTLHVGVHYWIAANNTCSLGPYLIFVTDTTDM